MNDTLLDSRLRDGLRQFAVPVAAPDFDERVLRALRMPPPWHIALWNTLRPAAVSGFGAMFVMLGVIWLTTSGPIVERTALPSNVTMANIDWNVVERALDRPVVTAASLQECLRTAANYPPALPGNLPSRKRPVGHASRPQYMA